MMATQIVRDPALPAPTLDIWLSYARLGIPVVPEQTPDPTAATRCDCRRDDCRKPGKHPRTMNGSKDATTHEATIRRWHYQWPHANLGTSLEMARLVIIGPDSPTWHAEFQQRGLVDGPVAKSGGGKGHFHYYRRLPKDVPATRICKPGKYDILATGNAILPPSLHASGNRYEWIVPITSLDDVPDLEPWACEMLREAAAKAVTVSGELSAPWGGGDPPVRLHRRGRQRFDGELVQIKDGNVDRSESLFFLGLDLAEGGADRGLVAAVLEERDAALGWNTYTSRGDKAIRYGEIAAKAVKRAVEREQAPRLQVVPTPEPATVPDDIAALRAALEAERAENARLRRALIDRDDRLEVLEDLVHTIDDVLGRPDEELSSDDKVVTIAGARWLPYYRSKRLAKEAPPTISLGYLSRVVGMPSRRVSKSLDRQSSDDPNAGAPFRKRVTRTFLDDEQRWESTLEVIPWADRTTETLRAAATYATPARPKRGGSRAAADARWGRCDKHDNREVRVKGYCPDCGAVVGERIVRLAEFDALNVQVEHSGDRAHHGAEGLLVDVQVGHSEPLEPCDVASGSLNLQPVHSAPSPDELAPRRNGHAGPSAPAQGVTPLPWGSPAPAPTKPPPWRCPECRASERKVRPDGSWRCPKGHVSHESAEVAG